MKTIKRSIAIILCLISVGALCGCGSGAKGPEEALKEYFEAYNKMDLEAIHNATYPEANFLKRSLPTRSRSPVWSRISFVRPIELISSYLEY